jgi:SM-20-related protein
MQSHEAWPDLLAEHGWVVSDDLIEPDLCKRLYAHCLHAWQHGFFHPAAVGRGSNQAVHTAIRGDAISWIEPDDPSVAVAEFLLWAEALRQSLNQSLFAGVQTTEFHFARYPPGQGYKKHMDQHRDQRLRRISLALYLNEHWTEEDGGQLCLYAPDDPQHETARVLPKQGRVVLFRSDVILHEVLPCHRPRYSLTGWFRTASDLPLPI